MLRNTYYSWSVRSFRIERLSRERRFIIFFFFSFPWIRPGMLKNDKCISTPICIFGQSGKEDNEIRFRYSDKAIIITLLKVENSGQSWWQCVIVSFVFIHWTIRKRVQTSGKEYTCSTWPNIIIAVYGWRYEIRIGNGLRVNNKCNYY